MKHLRANTVLKIALHIIAWVLVILALNSETVNLDWGAFVREERPILIPIIYGTALGAIIFYLNTGWLIPTYFGKNKKGKYWIRALLLLLIITVIETLVDAGYIIYTNYDLAMTQLSSEPSYVILYWLSMLFMVGVTANLACWILAFAFIMPQEWVKNEKQKNIL